MEDMEDMEEIQGDTTQEPEAPTKPETRLQELRRRLVMYKDMEANILTGGAQSYNVGNRQLSRYGVTLTEIKATIKELESEINAELRGRARWRGNMYPIDN
jgi:hypothetical protein